MRKVNFTETVLRDGNQSLIATRMAFDQFAPILEEMDKVGYNSIECWGGATFDSCIRFLNEDPWERLRKMRKAMPNTKLQMLLRGQNLVGYRHYADDVVDELGSRKEVEYLRTILKNGTGADRQLAVYEKTKDLTKVVDYIMEQTILGTT